MNGIAIRQRIKFASAIGVVFCFLLALNGTCQTKSSKAESEKEEFIQFMGRFSLDDKFQLQRIKFPLFYSSLDESFTKEIKTYLKKEDWKFEYVFFKPDQESYQMVYDNFGKKLRDTDERVIVRHGNGNGILVCYYFHRINGKWYLVKKEDHST